MRVRVNLRPGRPSDAEQRHGRSQIDAVVLRGEASDEARQPIARRLRPHPEEAGRGAQLEEQGLLARGERDGPLEAADRVASLAPGRGPGEQAFALQPVDLGLDDALAGLGDEGRYPLQQFLARRTLPAAR